MINNSKIIISKLKDIKQYINTKNTISLKQKQDDLDSFVYDINKDIRFTNKEIKIILSKDKSYTIKLIDISPLNNKLKENTINIASKLS